jgi:SecD-like export protein
MSTELTPTITDDEVAELPLGDARAELLRELLSTTRAVTAPARRSRRWPAALAAAAALVVLALPLGLGQLGDDDDGTVTDPGTTSSPPAPAQGPAAFQVRFVGLTSEVPRRSDPEWQELDAFVCPDDPVAVPAAQAQLACDAAGTKYLLGNAAVEGGVVDAQAVQPLGAGGWVISLELDDEATDEFAGLTRQLVGSTTQVALVLDGEVLSATTINGVIDTGQLQVAGDLTETEATELAARLSQ